MEEMEMEMKMTLTCRHAVCRTHPVALPLPPHSPLGPLRATHTCTCVLTLFKYDLLIEGNKKEKLNLFRFRQSLFCLSNRNMEIKSNQIEWNDMNRAESNANQFINCKFSE